MKLFEGKENIWESYWLSCRE